MAQVAKSGTPSIATTNPPPNSSMTRPVGEVIEPGDYVYLKSDGKFWRTNGVADNAAARWLGITSARQSVVGEPLTAHHGVIYHYGSGLIPGTRYYLSDSVPGGLADAPTTGSPINLPVACAYDDKAIYVFSPQR